MQVGLFPLPNVVLFPGTVLPLLVFEPRYRALVEDALARDRAIGVPRLRPGYQSDYYGNPALFPIFGVGRIVEHERLPDGRYRIAVLGRHRALIDSELSYDPYRVAEVTLMHDAESESPLTVQALRSTLYDQIARLARHSPLPLGDLLSSLRTAANAGACADLAASMLTSEVDARQDLLEQVVPSRRLEAVLDTLYDALQKLEPSGPPAASN